jgi:YaiO family outer membrane protein
VQLNLAKALTLNSNIKEAETLYSSLIKKFPLNSELFIGQGFLNLRKGEMILAQKSFIDAQRIDGTNEDVNTGFLLVKERMDKEKVGFFISGEEKKADAFIEEKNFKSAIQVYENLLNKYPENLDIETDIVRAYRLDSQIIKAEKRIDELIKKYPENADLWVERGQVYSLKGNQKLSKQSFEKALNLEANNREIQNRLIRLKKDKEFNSLMEIVKNLGKEKDYVSAELQIRKKLNEDPKENRVQYLLAQNLRYQRKYKETLEILNELINQNPENVDYLASRGIVWRGLRRVKEAKKDNEMALSKDPERADILLGRGYVAVMEKEYFKAEDYFQNVLKREPENQEAIEATMNIENFVKDQVVESFYVETFTGDRDPRYTQNLEWIHPFNSKLKGNIGHQGVHVSDDFDQTGFLGASYDVMSGLNVRGKFSFAPNADFVAKQIYETEIIKGFKGLPFEALFLYRFMDFAESDFHLFSPGVNYYFNDQTSALMRGYFGFQENGNSRAGFINVYHKVNPRLTTYFGGSVGNETFRIVTGGDTRPVDSFAVQAGFKWRVSDTFSFGLNYLYQERKNQFNRNLFGLVIPIRL